MINGRTVLLIGGAGFIGSTLARALIDRGCSVTVYDNLSTGERRFLPAGVRLIHADIGDEVTLRGAMAGCEVVMHLAANADVRHGPDHPERDLEINLIGTWHVLEAMRLSGVRELVFASTSAVYGEPELYPTPEDSPFPQQTSLYGASKLGAEGYVSAYAQAYGFRAGIVRLVSAVGERYSHGHVFDFTSRLIARPDTVEVLGDGKQRKSYLYVGDCAKGFVAVAEHLPAAGQTAIYNVGGTPVMTVDESLDVICAELGVDPRRSYQGGARGWVGDSPVVELDATRLGRLGWHPTVRPQEGIRRTVRWLVDNQWIFEARR